MTCKMVKKHNTNKRAPLTNMPVTDVFQRVHMDIIGPISDSCFKYFLLVVDSFSKWHEAFPLRTETAKKIANILYSEIFCRYGAPRVPISDRGQNFMSKVVTALCEIFKVTRHFTSSYHPQTNATCERTNSTLEQCLLAYIDYN